MLNSALVDKIIELALLEDIGSGDLTTKFIAPFLKRSKYYLLAKEDFVVCGLPLVEKIFNSADKNVMVNYLKNDGDFVNPGDILAEITGEAATILKLERTVLNFLQRLSGIATNTYKYVKALEGTNIKILDTRKTTPGMRVLEKYAVRTGGGTNHRIGLFDGVMLKDTHIDAVGSIRKAVEILREGIPITVKIEVETRNLDEVAEAVEAGADIIMLDNFPLDKIKEACQIVNGRARIEVSGGVTLEKLALYKNFPIDYISVGALTNRFKAVDISMKFGELL
ncbi:carboxylating nicotinate-nucleotide diphosphorylase [Deferribacter autotrophicus]|uniref:Probable nicotinate-nucleotide pyrophosphorylase [carboxylating] n=1 Tax=Deferribacter autotrophicus TaxID=500465 RepID=A0A5A8F1Q7_9BACT|nr:carboxylating nicotinate-nucleotide diphosphorylase [Deferribacter autotrophicus]KAA0256816.1 carboxylating nicotinate-nucleotide diphosphorylase [Deferribacter autotrophicus]